MLIGDTLGGPAGLKKLGRDAFRCIGGLINSEFDPGAGACWADPCLDPATPALDGLRSGPESFLNLASLSSRKAAAALGSLGLK